MRLCIFFIVVFLIASPLYLYAQSESMGYEPSEFKADQPSLSDDFYSENLSDKLLQVLTLSVGIFVQTAIKNHTKDKYIADWLGRFMLAVNVGLGMSIFPPMSSYIHHLVTGANQHARRDRRTNRHDVHEALQVLNQSLNQIILALKSADEKTAVAIAAEMCFRLRTLFVELSPLEPLLKRSAQLLLSGYDPLLPLRNFKTKILRHLADWDPDWEQAQVESYYKQVLSSLFVRNVEFSVYLVVGIHDVEERQLLASVEKALQGGLSVLQFDPRKKDPNEARRLGKKLQVLAHQYKTPFLVNSDIALARELDADGIHFMKADTAQLVLAREILGIEALIGVSIRNVDQIPSSELCNYISVGPIFHSQTYPKVPAVGLDTFKHIRQVYAGKLIAAGGIRESNVKPLFEAGADGVVVISALLNASDPESAARNLKFLASSGSSRAQGEISASSSRAQREIADLALP